MPTISLVLMALAAILHIGFFVIGSVVWRRPEVHRIFGVKSAEDAETMAFALYNQGFYNLFLALGAFAGIGYSSTILTHGRDELLVFTALFMIGAAAVLVASNGALWRGAGLQGGLPALALLIALVV